MLRLFLDEEWSSRRVVTCCCFFSYFFLLSLVYFVYFAAVLFTVTKAVYIVNFELTVMLILETNQSCMIGLLPVNIFW